MDSDDPSGTPRLPRTVILHRTCIKPSASLLKAGSCYVTMRMLGIIGESAAAYAYSALSPESKIIGKYGSATVCTNQLEKLIRRTTGLQVAWTATDLNREKATWISVTVDWSTGPTLPAGSIAETTGAFAPAPYM